MLLMDFKLLSSSLFALLPLLLPLFPSSPLPHFLIRLVLVTLIVVVVFSVRQILWADF